MENLATEVGKVIKQQRKSARLTLDKLAERLGSNKQYIHKLEKGEKNITLAQLEKVLNALGKKGIFKVK